MSRKLLQKIFLSAITVALTVLNAGIACAESDIARRFIAAHDVSDQATMNNIVKENKAKIAEAVMGLIEDAQSLKSQGERERLFYMAEMLARTYYTITGDSAPLLASKRRSFDARLSAPERSAPVNGVYIVNLPKVAPGVMNIFLPNNIIVKKGSTVRWVNQDVAEHIFASMPVIGEGGLSSGYIEPGRSWDHKFDKSGEYYYLCFIHHVMVGKVTVEDELQP